MKIDLSQLDLEGMTLDLDRSNVDEPGQQQLVHIVHARGVRGTAEHTPAGLALESATISELLVRLMRVRLGKVLLEFHEAVLTNVHVQLSTGAAGLDLKLTSHSLVSPRIRIELTDTVILGRGRFEGVSLLAQSGEGRIDVEAATVRGLAVDLAALTIRSHELQTTEVGLRWGDVFHLAMHQPRLDTLALGIGDTQLEATNVAASTFALTGGDIQLENLQLPELKLAHAFGAAATEDDPNAAPSVNGAPEMAASSTDDDEDEETLTPARPDVARIVDGLSGHLHADVAVEVTLPVLMSRGAVHKLRLGVEDGTINFRRLEQGLSLLEDALLDFSVRANALVLEVGLPLLPTRGFGKPIVRWPLADHELELARQNRIHLSTLLSPMAVQSKRNGGAEAGDNNRLRHLEVRELDCELTLAHEDPTSVVRMARLDQLRLAGQLLHRPDGATSETSIHGSAQQLALDIQGWQFDDKHLEMAGCRVAAIPALELTLANGKPVRLTLALTQATVERARWAKHR